MSDKSKFPKTRYQGSKLKLKDWIKSTLEEIEFETALDAFSGTSTVSYLLKEMGKTVYSNDILKFNNQVAKALIENNKETINEDDIKFVITNHPDITYSFFIRDNFEDIYYLTEENEWLDIAIQNILSIKNEYKRAMLFWALYQAAISKRPYNLFHRKNLYVRTSEVERNFGNKTTWDKPFEEHFRKFINEINNAILDNGKENKCFCSDIFELEINTPDLVYIDPPYIPEKGSITKYRDFYHLLDGMTDYHNWEGQIDYDSKHLKLKSEYNIWEDKKNIHKAFEQLIEKFKDSVIVISYREDGIPTLPEIENMMKKYKNNVEIKTIDYKYVFSKKQNLKEVLIIGS